MKHSLLQQMLTEALKNTYPYSSFDDTQDEHVKDVILIGRVPFIQVVHVYPREQYAGWKFTITGNTVEDAIWLYDNLGKYLKSIKQPFKMGTHKLIKTADPEQAHKLMTIYIMKNTKVDYLLQDIKYYLKGYTCRYKLKYSEHVEGPIWKRHDTDENGNYIPADPNKRYK